MESEQIATDETNFSEKKNFFLDKERESRREKGGDRVIAQIIEIYYITSTCVFYFIFRLAY